MNKSTDSSKKKTSDGKKGQKKENNSSDKAAPKKKNESGKKVIDPENDFFIHDKDGERNDEPEIIEEAEIDFIEDDSTIPDINKLEDEDDDEFYVDDEF